MIKIKRGLNLPIDGTPEQKVEDGRPVRSVALMGDDYVGMKPTMNVQVGDRVKLGDPLFSDKKTPGVQFTAPACGVVSAINRGHRRTLESVVIDIEGDEERTFSAYSADQLSELARAQVKALLVESGLWTALRTRPYDRIPAVEGEPHSIFVCAMDTNPLAADPEVIIATRADEFANGLRALSRLTDGSVFAGKAVGSEIPTDGLTSVRLEEFRGPHPAGLVGTHIHFLDPVGPSKTVWHVGYQDVIAIGHLFATGRILTERVVAVGGPPVRHPRLLRVRLGANTDEVLAGEIPDGDLRVVSGSLLSGHIADGPKAFLGRYHHQISVLREGREKELFGWLKPGKDCFSASKAYTSHFKSGRRFDFTTNTNGSERAMVPIGIYERVMPLDILPTQLLRSLIVMDTDSAQELGCLELSEEDLALCTFVCPGKYEYGPILRENLTKIEKEG